MVSCNSPMVSGALPVKRYKISLSAEKVSKLVAPRIIMNLTMYTALTINEL